jgi:glycine/D-amino acid oxidase-like deaminating enzyme
MSHAISSIWAATAEPMPETPTLVGTQTADVAVIGAGITGLCAALRLAEGGASVAVLDAEAPGFGGSGRNGGQVIPGLKYDPDELDRMFGEATTDFVGKAADVTFGLVEKYGIACDAKRNGWIQGTVKSSHLAALKRRQEQWAARGAKTEMLDAAAIARITGARGYVGGWIDGRAGTLHPLNYVVGLTKAALKAGVGVHGKSRVTAMRKDGDRWTLETASGAKLSATHVVIGCNGYTDRLWPKLKATVVPASSFQVATAPLPPETLKTLLPEGMSVSDSRRIANYWRIGPGGRLMLGGRGTFTDDTVPEDYRRIAVALHAFFPNLRDVPLEFRWTGRVAMTLDHLPHIHKPAGNVIVAMGYNGRGVAMASATGTAIGAHILDAASPLPLRVSPIRPLPIHDFHPIYASLAIEYYRLRDALES